MKLTKEILEQHVSKREFMKVGHKTTICILTLDNGFEIVGSSACINPENFDLDLGKKYAYENAFEKLWELYGFLANYGDEFFSSL